MTHSFQTLLKNNQPWQLHASNLSLNNFGGIANTFVNTQNTQQFFISLLYLGLLKNSFY